ncbi:MAG: hypothetical protein L0H59_18075 [Tomitella sp.]|nr:hypothetical protein [Tomitella sp.]
MGAWAVITAAVLGVAGFAAIGAALLTAARRDRFRWILGGSAVSLPLLCSAEALLVAYIVV